jgi:dTDP-4-amino-4,6-dideoxygalactose transaminase
VITLPRATTSPMTPPIPVATPVLDERGIILPLVPSMTASQVQEVCESLGAALGHRT